MLEAVTKRHVTLDVGDALLPADIVLPTPASGLVIFVHGSGSSRLSPRNTAVAQQLQQHGFATLLFDLLTEEEDQDRTRRFDIPLLARRVEAVSHWVSADVMLREFRVGYFGASTGAAAALVAAANRPQQIKAVVSRGGRPDLAGEVLPQVRAPTLLIVGGNDFQVLEYNRAALEQLGCEKNLEVVPEATHLFEEPGAMLQVMTHTLSWFEQYLQDG